MSVSDQPTRKHTLRRRLVVTALVVLVLAALALTPPYLNVNRYRRRIATTISQSLGRPVHLDNVTLHLLPVPGFTLSNLVVSEDPAFGYEPVIRANTVEASIRAGSLWRRHVEFSTIRFIDPSVNLVRNAQGRWNLEDVLMQASHVETAPTAQVTAGPAPRFPYIEASGARVNVKIGNEKKPFALTDAQFALWLPSPQLWRVRLRGKPARTDNNLSQTGEIDLEGSLQRARKMADVPVDLQASWNGAPLGEASRLLTGKDAGWRGTIFVEAHITGALSAAQLQAHVQLNDLRRADYVPAQPLDVSVDCSSTADIAKATLVNVGCSTPVGSNKPLTLTAPAVDLERPATAEAKLTVSKLPVLWLLGWEKLFLPSMPASLDLGGVADGELNWNSTAASWQGTVIAQAADQAADASNGPTGQTPRFTFTIDSSPGAGAGMQPPIVRLAPTVMHPAVGSVLAVSGQADANGYALQANGTATNSQVEALAKTLPPLNEGVEAALPSESKSGALHPIALSCSRSWSSEQVCVAAMPQPTARTNGKKRHR